MIEIKRIDQSHVGSKSYFYIDGDVVGTPGRLHMCNQMFVEALFPKVQKHPYPLVMFHGADPVI